MLAKTKKFLAIALTLCLAASFIPVPVNAATVSGQVPVIANTDVNDGITYLEDEITRDGDDTLVIDKSLAHVENDIYEMTLTLRGGYSQQTSLKYVVLVLDMTGSMCGSCKTSPCHSDSCNIAQMRNSAKTFVDALLEVDPAINIAIEVYGRIADFAVIGDNDTDPTFTSDQDVLEGRIDALRYADPFGVSSSGEIHVFYNLENGAVRNAEFGDKNYEGTNTADALRVAKDALDLQDADNDQKMIVFFSDGEPTAYSTYADDTVPSSMVTEADGKISLDKDLIAATHYNFATQASKLARDAADYAKEENGGKAITVHSIGFNIKSSSNAASIMKYISSVDEYYGDGAATSISEAFGQVTRDITRTPLAQNVFLQDIIPEDYTIVPYSGGAYFNYQAKDTALKNQMPTLSGGNTITWGGEGCSLSTVDLATGESHVTIQYLLRPNYSVIKGKLTAEGFAEETITLDTNQDLADEEGNPTGTFVTYDATEFDTEGMPTGETVAQDPMPLPVPQLTFRLEDVDYTIPSVSLSKQVAIGTFDLASDSQASWQNDRASVQVPTGSSAEFTYKITLTVSGLAAMAQQQGVEVPSLYIYFSDLINGATSIDLGDCTWYDASGRDFRLEEGGFNATDGTYTVYVPYSGTVGSYENVVVANVAFDSSLPVDGVDGNGNITDDATAVVTNPGTVIVEPNYYSVTVYYFNYETRQPMSTPSTVVNSSLREGRAWDATTAANRQFEGFALVEQTGDSITGNGIDKDIVINVYYSSEEESTTTEPLTSLETEPEETTEPTQPEEEEVDPTDPLIDLPDTGVLAAPVDPAWTLGAVAVLASLGITLKARKKDEE